MKRFTSMLLAVILSVAVFCVPAGASAQTSSLDEIFDSQLGSLDYFHELSPSYMAFRVSRDLYDLYLPDDLGEDEYEYRISAEIYEAYLFTLFEVSDSWLRSVRICAYYDEADHTYLLEYIGGFGGSMQPREYQGFKNNGDGTYSVFYATINYLYLPSEEEDKAADLDWPGEYEYNGKIYECGPEGYYYIDGILKSGRVYTVSYNEETGIVRLIAQNDYTETDIPASYDKEDVPTVIYYEMRQDLGLEFDFGENGISRDATIYVYASKLAKGSDFENVATAMTNVADNFTAFSITAKDIYWKDVIPKEEITVSFDIPSGYQNPAVYLISNARTAIKLETTIDAANGKIHAKTGAFGTFIVCDAKLPTYTLGDLNANGEIEKYDYIAVKRAVMGTLALNDVQKLAADVNGKDGVEKYDYILIKRHVMGTFTIGG